MADYSLGKAEGEIVLTYQGEAVARAQKDVEGLSKGSMSATAAMDKTARGAGLAGAAIAGGLALAVNSAANFEQRLSAVGAVSNATEEDMEAVRKKALQLGKDTVFSATDAATAMEELAKAGLTIPQIMNGAADATVALAAAGEVELPRAAEIAANAMNMFNLSAKDMPHVADLLAGAANASAVSVDELAMSLSQAGAVANTVGLDIDDTTAAIGLLGNAGIKGSDAGTSLKTMLLNLQPTTQKQIKLFKELGIVTEDGANRFFDAQGNVKSMAQISGVLEKSLKGMTKQQKLATLETMFGTDAIRAAAVFADQGSKGFNKFTKSMSGITAADVAAKRMDNLKGDLEALKGSLETAGIAIGTILIPALRSVTDAVTGALNSFLNLGEGTQKIIAFSAAALAGFLLIVAGVLKMIIFINRAREAFVALRLAIAGTWLAALGPIALIIAAIALVGVAILILWNKSETFRAGVLAIWGAIKAAAAAVASWFMGTFVPAMVAVWNAIKTGVGAIVGAFVTAWNAIKTAVTAVWNAISTVISTYIAVWTAIITTGLNVIKAVWNAVWGTFGPLITGIFNLIKAIITLVLTIIVGIITVQLRVIKLVFTTVWNAIKAVTSTVWNAIKTVVSAVVNAIKTTVSTVFNAIKSVATSVWNAIKSVVSTAVNNLKNNVQSVFNAVKSIVTTIWTAIDNAIGDKIRAAVNKVRQGVQNIRDFFNGAINWLVSAGRDIIQGLINGLTEMIPAILRKVTDLVNTITDKVKGLFKIGSPSKVMAAIGKDVAAGIAVGLGQASGEIADAATNLAKDTRDAINEELEKDKISKKAADRLKSFMADQINALNDFAEKRDRVSERLKIARDKLEEAIKVRDDYAKSAAQAAASFGAVTAITAAEDEKLNAGTLVAGMQQRLAAIVAYKNQLAALTAQGLNNQSFDQLVQAGVESGSAYASAILEGGPDAIANINSIQAQIASASATLGTDASIKMYQAGVDAAQALVDGLKTKQGELTDLMKDLAKQLVKAIRKALKIKSPSRVMLEQAMLAMDGLILGIDQAAGDVYRAMSRAVSPLPSALAGVAPGGRTATAATAPTTAAGHVDARQFNLEAHTDADAGQLMEEFAWASTTTLMGVTP